uniref:Uncharacterized protein n=1 Tax=Avena sativa TaxID=4498 RepID=A0ACD5TZT6_AVESA
MVDPALRFLHGYDRVTLLSCCCGILLCGGWDRDRTTQRQVYLVCNPATEQIWEALPVPAAQAGSKNRTIYLCVDDRRRFAVFFFIHDLYHTQQVQVYSSDTGEWTCVESGWGPRIVVSGGESDYFFFNGTLHFTAYDCGEETFDSEGNRVLKITGWVVTVDMDAKTWRTIRAPHKAFFSFIGQSQGRIYGLQMYRSDYRLSVWFLEDYASGQWILRSILELLGRRPYRNPGEFYSLVAIHPEFNLVFLIGGDGLDKKLMSYDMDNRKLHVIYTLEEYDKLAFWPYIPCFEERPSDSAQ